MLEDLLSQAQNLAEQTEIFQVSSRSTPVSFEANRLKSVDDRDSNGVALRIIKNGRIGFSSTTNMADMNGLVARAVEILPFGAKASMEFPPASQYADIPTFDQATSDLKPEELVETGSHIIDKLHTEWPDVMWSASLSKTIATTRLLNSNGCHAEETTSAISIGVEGTLVKGTDMFFAWESQSTCYPTLDISKIVRSIERKLYWAEDVAPAPNGSIPVIFTPSAVADLLLEPLLEGFNGTNIVQGSSPLIEKLTTQMLDPRITLWNDPTIPYIPGSSAFDDEGIPCNRLPLIQKGVISNFIFDLQTAGQAGVRSTGNAHRGLGSQPAPDSSVLIIDPGETTFSEMIAGYSKALIVESFLGAGQGNTLGGDFSANVLLGYAVENGKVVGRVKDTMVAGNVYNILKNLDALGSESEWVEGFLLAPALSCTGVSVSSKS
ncbi:MAG: TldD/PmbA family protein [Chloroflexota bacterium]|nr:TldD/PmbA family protein [Chloroflexota bacterium]